MQPGRDIQFCLWIVRRWYFSFPAVGILYAVIYLLSRGGAGLSPLQTLGAVGIMAVLPPYSLVRWCCWWSFFYAMSDALENDHANERLDHANR